MTTVNNGVAVITGAGRQRCRPTRRDRRGCRQRRGSGDGKPDAGVEQLYHDIVDTNLNGVWHTIAATVPSMLRKGSGGSIILVSSMQGLVGRGGDGSAATFAYAASKHGVVGLMRSAANAYAAQIR